MNAADKNAGAQLKVVSAGRAVSPKPPHSFPDIPGGLGETALPAALPGTTLSCTRNADLRRRLLALGFDAVRFARIEPGAQSRPAGALRSWLGAGYHAGMDWIARGLEKRENPGLVLPGAASVVALGVNYGSLEGRPSRQFFFSGKDAAEDTEVVPPSAGGARAGELRWARYARYADYHDTIKPALVAAGRVLEKELGVTPDDYRCYVDTGPVLERAWAERAGVGFIGKNAMLISRDYGNWLFLAAILVRAEIPPDEPEPRAAGRFRLCGKCTRCMDACPTRALADAGVVDARLCISYQTIENKGVIPRELRAKIGARIYGCDECAEVCPWNRFARESRGVLLDARPELARLSLRDALALTPEKFATIFRKTAVKRIKLAGLLRNACVVAGNAGGRECLGELVTLAGHPSPLVRVHAVWAVFQIAGRGRAAELLREARASETDADVLREYAAH